MVKNKDRPWYDIPAWLRKGTADTLRKIRKERRDIRRKNTNLSQENTTIIHDKQKLEEKD